MSTAQRVGAETAARINSAMESAGYHRQGLGREAGIPRETIARKLERTPELFTIHELCAIADVLGVPFEQLVGGIPAALP